MMYLCQLGPNLANCCSVVFKILFICYMIPLGVGTFTRDLNIVSIVHRAYTSKVQSQYPSPSDWLPMTDTLRSLMLLLYIPVNSYGHVGTVSSPNHTFFLGKLA